MSSKWSLSFSCTVWTWTSLCRKRGGERFSGTGVTKGPAAKRDTVNRKKNTKQRIGGKAEGKKKRIKNAEGKRRQSQLIGGGSTLSINQRKRSS